MRKAVKIILRRSYFNVVYKYRFEQQVLPVRPFISLELHIRGPGTLTAAAAKTFYNLNNKKTDKE